MSAGDECLQVLGENRPRRASEESKMVKQKPCLHSTFAVIFVS